MSSAFSVRFQPGGEPAKASTGITQKMTMAAVCGVLPSGLRRDDGHGESGREKSFYGQNNDCLSQSQGSGLDVRRRVSAANLNLFGSYWSAEALFDCDGGSGVPTDALSRDGPFYKDFCEPIYVLKPLPMSGVPNLLAG